MSEHPIRRYCKEHQLTQLTFARMVGRSPQYICDMIKGRASCGRISALSIMRATGGEIGLEEILTWEPEDERAPE